MVLVLSKWERHTVLCFLLVLAGFTEGMECQVDDIVYKVNTTTSTISYEIILQDRNCPVKKEWIAYLTSCVRENKFEQRIKLQVSGQFLVWKKGIYKMDLPGHKSQCFSAPGIEVFPSPIAIFNERGLNFTFTKPDERVKTWDLFIYRAQERTHCNTYWKFKEIDRITSVGNRSSLLLKYSFNLTDCYCFMLYPIGNMRLNFGGRFKVLDCKPDQEIRDPRKKNNTKFEIWQVLTLVILIAVIVMATLALLLYTIYKRRSRYICNTISKGINNNNTAGSTLHIREVLLLYDGNLQHNQQAMTLRNCLQRYFKVHDLYKHNDMERLADCTDWLLRTLLQSSMKIVLVDSPTMATLYHAQSTLDNEQDSVEVLAEEQHTLLQLRFALRHIITTSLMQDYSRVFVVRFDDVSVEEEKVGHVVNSRWYNFPSQHNLLLNDVSGCRT